MKYLSLQQMSERLGFSAKTFRKYVREYQIPFIALGNHKRFDPVTVEAYLSARLPVQNTVVTFKPSVRKSKQSRFAEAVGI